MFYNIFREIRLNDNDINNKENIDIKYCNIKNKNIYCDNSIITSKYNIYTFLPLSLFEQFRRLANVYFLMISILMLIGTYTYIFQTPVEPWSTIQILIIVLLISITKELIEDNKRHEADKEINYQKICLINKIQLEKNHINNKESIEQIQNLYTEINWKDINVGDLLLINQNKTIPADILVLFSSDINVYTETSNIDGESNLKIKIPIKNLIEKSLIRYNNISIDELLKMPMLIKYESPSANINKFDGVCNLINIDEEKVKKLICKEFKLDINNILLRGSVLKNTTWIIGLVLYTGKQTKVSFFIA